MNEGKPAGPDDQRRDVSAAWILGAVVALGLGALRGTEQIVVRNAFAHPMPVVWAMVLASAIWLPVPLALERVLRAGIAPRVRWGTVGILAALASVVEPLWFFGILASVFDWRPPGGYWINGALRLDTNLLIFAVIVGWLWLRKLEQRREMAAERASVLRARASGAELDVLTMQLQPHFLFNTLNLVSQLAFESTLRARRAIANLRRLLEESVAPDRATTVTLGEELRFLEAYLDLQRDRFGARLDARVVADVDLLGARVPRMLLQPIVENAIRHGIAPRKSGGVILVRVRRAPGERVSIEVADDGLGLRGEGVREGMGLTNARHRLEQLYPGATMMDVSERTGGGVSTRVELPLDAPPATATLSEGVEDDSSNDVDEEPLRHTSVALRAMVMVLGWALVAAIWTELEALVPMASQEPVPWANLFANNLLNASVWIALTPLTLRLADALALRRRGGRIAAHAVGAVVFTVAHLAATAALMRSLLHANQESVRAFQSNWLVWDLIAYAVLVAIGEAIAARGRLREQRVEASRAAGRLAAARVSLLRLQLQPSLLLSAVDAVDAATGDPVRCETTIARLGDVLRSLLATSGNEQTTLRGELALLENYSAVLGARATVSVRDGVDLDASVPAVLLAPLLASVKGTSLRVDVALRSGRVAIELTMEGEMSLDSDVLARTERRLAAMYAGEHVVRFIRRDADASILLELPYHPGTTKQSTMTVLDRRAIA